jgi:hypothetical protein
MDLNNIPGAINNPVTLGGWEKHRDDSDTSDSGTEVSSANCHFKMTDSHDKMQDDVREYGSSDKMFQALRLCFKQESGRLFYGSYQIADDPLINDKERVRMTTHEIWQVTGYRFT